MLAWGSVAGRVFKACTSQPMAQAKYAESPGSMMRRRAASGQVSTRVRRTYSPRARRTFTTKDSRGIHHEGTKYTKNGREFSPDEVPDPPLRLFLVSFVSLW